MWSVGERTRPKRKRVVVMAFGFGFCYDIDVVNCFRNTTKRNKTVKHRAQWYATHSDWEIVPSGRDLSIPRLCVRCASIVGYMERWHWNDLIKSITSKQKTKNDAFLQHFYLNSFLFRSIRNKFQFHWNEWISEWSVESHLLLVSWWLQMTRFVVIHFDEKRCWVAYFDPSLRLRLICVNVGDLWTGCRETPTTYRWHYGDDSTVDGSRRGETLGDLFICLIFLVLISSK